MRARRGRSGRRVGLLWCVALLCASGAAVAAAASPAMAVSPWSPLLQAPGGGEWAVHDAYAFGTTGLALAGDGHVAVTSDGGQTWNVTVPAGHSGTAFTAVAFRSSGRGVVASGGLLLVTDDWGKTWKAPAYVGPGAGAAIDDIALRGSRAVAVGDAGTILTSADSGATWQLETSPTTDPLTSVAIAGDDTTVAGSPAGEIVVGTTSWAVAGTSADPVTSVAAAASPTWGDGQPDLFVATGHDVLGSDDALTFASLPGLPDLSTQDWPAIASTGLPGGDLLMAGGEQAGFFGSGPSWVSGASGLADGVTAAVAPSGQSVAYLLGTDGKLVRTLSAGRDPAAVTLTQSRVVAGATTQLTATLRIAAPGALLVRARVPGHLWTTLRRIDWAATDWGRQVTLTLAPTLTHDYELDFEYGGTTTQLAPPTRVVAVPMVATAHSRYDLRVGAVFRFSGSVAPLLPGERVELYTDRGGSWRPVSLQHSVALRNGHTWTSRAFGTPKAETYHLRAHVVATRQHAEAWSRIVTVAIR